MATYTSPTLSDYNDEPPLNDGSADDANNLVDWDRHIDEIGDPLKNYIDDLDTQVSAAFAFYDLDHTDVGFQAKANSGAISDSWSQVSYPTEGRDPDGNYSSSYYTCPTDGIYLFEGQTTVATLPDGAYLQVAIRADTGSGDAAWRISGREWNNTGSGALVVCNIMSQGFFSAGDKISIYAEHSDTGSLGCITSDGYNYFHGFRLTNTEV